MQCRRANNGLVMKGVKYTIAEVVELINFSIFCKQFRKASLSFFSQDKINIILIRGSGAHRPVPTLPI